MPAIKLTGSHNVWRSWTYKWNILKETNAFFTVVLYCSLPHHSRQIADCTWCTEKRKTKIEEWKFFVIAEGEGWSQGVKRRCRLSWQTNSALVNRVQMRGGGYCGASANEYICANHVTWSPNKLWRSNYIFNLWLKPIKTAAKKVRDSSSILSLTFWTVKHAKLVFPNTLLLASGLINFYLKTTKCLWINFALCLFKGTLSRDFNPK